MPSFFLTLTADEASETRWPGFNDLECFWHKFSEDMTWQDAPVECTRLSISRCKAFLRDHVFRDGILGKVDHHVIPWEAQHRGSLHAHVLLWVDEADVDRVSDEIMAYVPATFDEEHQRWNAPDPNLQPHEHVCLNLCCASRCTAAQNGLGGPKAVATSMGVAKCVYPVPHLQHVVPLLMQVHSAMCIVDCAMLIAMWYPFIRLWHCSGMRIATCSASRARNGASMC